VIEGGNLPEEWKDEWRKLSEKHPNMHHIGLKLL
jgi:hypothetical protein